VQAPPQNPQPGVEGNHNKKRESSNDTFVMFNSTGKGSGYNKMLDNEDELVTVYPEGWNQPTGEYTDVTQLAIYNAEERAQVAAADVNDWLDGFYDDDLWWALAWIAAYDVTQDKEYLTLAEGIFAAVATTWGTNCGNGGIYWSWQRDYVNAIPNELFLSTAAHLANRADNKATYVAWAKAEIDWFTASGMINERGTINDGLTSDCKNNNMVRSLEQKGCALSLTYSRQHGLTTRASFSVVSLSLIVPPRTTLTSRWLPRSPKPLLLSCLTTVEFSMISADLIVAPMGPSSKASLFETCSYFTRLPLMMRT
jgi:hypothetical protein